MEYKSKSGCGRTIAIIGGIAGLTLVTAVVAVLLVRTYQPAAVCGDMAVLSGRTNLFAKEEASDAIDNLEIPDRGIMITRTYQSGLCFVMHKSAKPVGERARPMRRVGGSLTQGQLDFLGGSQAVQFCENLLSYMAVEMDADELSGRPKRASSLETPIEQREPRCEDILLLCPDQLNTTSTCFTWQNGIMFMERTCIAENSFKVRMTKPPGRILKIAQQAVRECLFRKQEGKRC